MARASRHSYFLAAVLFPTLTFAIAACAPLQARPGRSEVTCPDGTKRITVSCESITNLKARVIQANVGLPQIGLGIGAAYEQKAIEQVSGATQQLATNLDAKCNQYNSCVLDAATWMAEEQRLRTHVERVEQLQHAPSAVNGMAVWDNARPDLAANSLAFSYQVQARPAGADAFGVHHSGQPLRSGDEIRFVFRSLRSVYVYVLLLSSQGEASQLFPMQAIAIPNPVPGNISVVIPGPQQAFKLDEVVGKEHIQIIASLQPLADMEQRLRQLGPGGGGGQAAQQVLSGIGNLLCGEGTRGIDLAPSSVACDQVRSRGINLVPQTGQAPAAAPAAIRARPNDDIIVQQHEIDHQAPSATDSGIRTRGLVVGEDGFIVAEDG